MLSVIILYLIMEFKYFYEINFFLPFSESQHLQSSCGNPFSSTIWRFLCHLPKSFNLIKHNCIIESATLIIVSNMAGSITPEQYLKHTVRLISFRVVSLCYRMKMVNFD